MTNQSRVRSSAQAFHRSDAQAFGGAMDLWVLQGIKITEATAYPLSNTLRSETFFLADFLAIGIGGGRNTIWHSRRRASPTSPQQSEIHEIDTSDFSAIRSAGAPEFEAGLWRPAGGIGGDADTIWFLSTTATGQTNGKIHELSTTDLSEIRQSTPLAEGRRGGVPDAPDIGGDADEIFTIIRDDPLVTLEIRRRDPQDFSMDIRVFIPNGAGSVGGIGGTSTEVYFSREHAINEIDSNTIAIIRTGGLAGQEIKSVGG